MNLEHLNVYRAEKVRALFGLPVAALRELLAKVLPELLHRRQAAHARRPDRQRAVGGGRRRGLKPYQEVPLTLICLRHNGAHAVVGELFGVSASPRAARRSVSYCAMTLEGSAEWFVAPVIVPFFSRRPRARWSWGGW